MITQSAFTEVTLSLHNINPQLMIHICIYECDSPIWIDKLLTLESIRTKNTRIEWAGKNCHSAPVHIIVGFISSTYGKNDPRFVGEAGFSNYRGPSRLFPDVKRPHRIHIVAFIYAAACCQIQSLLRILHSILRSDPVVNL